jgi:hypothetical protein
MPGGFFMLTTFRALFLAHHPTRKARMNDADTRRTSRCTYTTLHHPISDSEIHAHLRGQLTLAAPLVGADGLAYAAALDIDHGGAGALRRVLAAAELRGLVAFAITSTNDKHDGGHVWVLFDQSAAPERLRWLADELAAAATVQAETYPTYKTIRLPLGVHRRSMQRGTLILPNWNTIDLDSGPDAVTHALRSLDARPVRNTIDRLPHLPTPEPAPAYRPRIARQFSSVIDDYNRQTNLLTVLESYRARVALQRGTTTVLHCPCGRHANGDQTPSLAVIPAKNTRYGPYIAHGYAPSCAFYTERGQVIAAFDVFCHMEQLSPPEAVQRIIDESRAQQVRS